MKIYTRAYNTSLGQMQLEETEMSVTFRSAVETMADLPTSGNTEGDIRLAIDIDHLFAYVGGAWIDQGAYDCGDLYQLVIMQSVS